jgi:hypothetical protein
MDELKDLLKIAFSKRVDKIELIYNGEAHGNSTMRKLADGIRRGIFASEEEAANKISGTDKNGPAYKMLKKRLKERLYNTLLFMQPLESKSDKYHLLVYECYKQMVVAKMLTSLGFNKSASRIMVRLITKAEPIELFEVVQQCAIALQRKSILEKSYVRFEEFNRIFESANKKLVAEARAEQMNYDVIVSFNNNLAHLPEFRLKLETYKKRIDRLQKRFPTFLINYYYYYISIVYNQLHRNYDVAVKLSAEFENFIINSGIFYNTQRHGNILTIRLDACLLAKNYTEGREAAEKAFGFYSKENINWFALQEMFFLLCLNTNNLKDAANSYVEVTSNPRYSQLEEHRRQLWKVYGAYLWFMLLYHGEQKNYPEIVKQYADFKFSYLINNISHYSKDKKGIWGAVLILQILFFLQAREFVEISTRIDAVRVYVYRYLNKKEAFRANIFVKMLLLMEKYNFDQKKLDTVASKHLIKLKEGEILYTPTQTQVEIVPYEDLWTIIINMLKDTATNHNSGMFINKAISSM